MIWSKRQNMSDIGKYPVTSLSVTSGEADTRCCGPDLKTRELNWQFDLSGWHNQQDCRTKSKHNDPRRELNIQETHPSKQNNTDESYLRLAHFEDVKQISPELTTRLTNLSLWKNSCFDDTGNLSASLSITENFIQRVLSMSCLQYQIDSDCG